ncbi:hypothetical protein CDL12_20528 [Handroanthus impetiginosus]|uniref:Retrotransposon Copia-like N-terminal domain-containing protein n=1 Tax=Handroanthus impetiginosus TaxID=429701 RepID=A0A2G9GPH5_9LAMI|nr:hypothetical protein CDL12_20528 [Handroanthus impetiginosus]
MASSSEHKLALGTTVKLNGQNYVLWSQAFRMFLGSQNKLSHITSIPPDKSDDKYEAWKQADYSVMTWLLNSLEESKNVSRVFELYEKLFSLKQDGSDARSLTDYFASLKGAADEILLYHPLGRDINTQKSQWNEFLVAKFLSGLHPNLRSVRDSLLASDTVPSISNALSRVLRVASAGSSGALPLTTTENSAMAIRGCGRGSSRGRGGQGGRSHGSTDSKGPRACIYCGRTNHISEKCWIKFGKPDWANAVTESSQPESNVLSGGFTV